MSNTDKGRGRKGSKFWMQVVVEDNTMQNELNRMIGEDLEWISPLAGPEETFDEYELCDPYVCHKLGIEKHDVETIFSFWPKKQPQWDGLALSKDGKTLYIVEAKAHVTEMESRCLARSEDSRRQIEKAINEVQEKYGITENNALWLNGYYQLANRLVFLHYLNKQVMGHIENVKLVLLNFVNDDTYISTSEESWREHYEAVWQAMLDRGSAPDDVLVLYFDVSGRGLKPNPTGGKPLKDYTRKYILRVCEEALQDISRFYTKDFINYRGKCSDTGELFTEVISQFVLKHLSLFLSIPMILRESSYRVEGHDGINDMSSVRREENLAKQMFQYSQNGELYSDAGQLIDYQIPLNGRKNDKAGKIDLLSYDGNLLRLLELKKEDSEETMLRCVLEGFTYLKQVNHVKLLENFQLPLNTTIKACPLVYFHGKQLAELDEPRIFLKTLMKAMDCEVCVYQDSKTIEKYR